MCAIHILGDAAKANLAALRVMQNLGQGEAPKSARRESPHTPSAQENSMFQTDYLVRVYFCCCNISQHGAHC